MSNTVSAAATGLQSAMPRRGFLRGLATLPLIGGAVSIIGTPVRADVAVTKRLLETYKTWLFYEHRRLSDEVYPGYADAERFIPLDNPALNWHWPAYRREIGPASMRASLVLSAVGCDWRAA